MNYQSKADRLGEVALKIRRDLADLAYTPQELIENLKEFLFNVKLETNDAIYNVNELASLQFGIELIWENSIAHQNQYEDIIQEIIEEMGLKDAEIPEEE